MGKVRRQKMNQIGDLLGIDNPSIDSSNGRLSAETCRQLYKEITGNEPEMTEHRGWHLKKACEEIDAVEYKSYIQSVSLSVDTMNEIIQHLKN